MSGLLEVCRDRTRGRPMSYQLAHTQLAHNRTALGEDFRREIWEVRLCDLGSLPNSHVTQRSWAPVPLPDQHLWWWQRQGANLTGDLLHYWVLLTAGNFCGASHETSQFFFWGANSYMNCVYCVSAFSSQNPGILFYSPKEYFSRDWWDGSVGKSDCLQV